MEHASGVLGGCAVYPNVHFLIRQAAREKLAAMRALTETARERHLALAEQYQRRAEGMDPGFQS